MKKLAILVVFFLLSAGVSMAAPMSMPGLNPEVINKQNQRQIEGQQVDKKFIQTVPEDLDKEKKQLEDAKKKETIQGNLTYNPSFKLNKVVFTGNTKIPEKQLQKLTAQLVGKEIRFEDILDLTVKASRYYQKKGYLTSYAYLEPQEVKDGVVVISIKESKVGDKEAIGNHWAREWYFKNVAMSGQGLQQDKIFNAKDLQGAMKTINQENYMKASAELSKDKNDDTIIKLHVADRFPLKFSLGWDDFGRDYTGRQRFTGILGLDNVTGIGDKIYGGAILGQDSTGALAGYQLPINKYGTKLAFDYAFSRVTLGGPYRNLDIAGNATDYAIRLTHPLINTATKELTASVSVDAVNSRSASHNPYAVFSNYHLRVLRLGLFGMFDDKHGRTIANIGTDLGTSALGASPNIDKGPQSAFYKILAGITRIQRLPKNCLGIVRVNGQYSPNALYSSEQMYLGGVYSVRGYQPSELLGDSGLSGTFELRTPVPGLEKILPEKYKSLSNRVKLAAFYDWGYVKDHYDLYGYPSHFLSSVGFGTYINLTDAIYLQMGIGIPVGPKNYNENKGRLYFSINTDIDKIFMKP